MPLTPVVAKAIAETGLSKIAHAIRRVGALYVAMNLLPEEASEQDLFATADRMAGWIRGGGTEAEPTEQPMGKSPWE